MLSLRGNGKREGYFRSYKAIGLWLAEHGETGTYYAIPSGIKSIAGMKSIHVIKAWENDEDGARWERTIEMDGSYF